MKSIPDPDLLKEFSKIPGVGTKLAYRLWELGVRSLDDLAGRDPEELYMRMCSMAGRDVDKCVLYVFRCAIYFASNRDHEPELLKWWNWKGRKL